MKNYFPIIKMSCSSSRALHNICVPGCPETGGVVLCPCPGTAAFACRDVCPCEELEDNVFFTQGRLANLICGEIQSLPVPLTISQDDLVTLLGDDVKYSQFRCPVVISFKGITGTLGTITNGTFVAALVQPTVPLAAQVLLVNGKECVDVTITT
jgi:hypothetical protein